MYAWLEVYRLKAWSGAANVSFFFVVMLHFKLSHFSACNTELLGVVWGQSYLSYSVDSLVFRPYKERRGPGTHCLHMHQISMATDHSNICKDVQCPIFFLWPSGTCVSSVYQVLSSLCRASERGYSVARTTANFSVWYFPSLTSSPARNRTLEREGHSFSTTFPTPTN